MSIFVEQKIKKLNKLITILGPTACGKTALAVSLAKRLDGAVISADSRQVYRGMDIGTGKDLSEYNDGEVSVPYYLIDIVNPGYKYNIYEYQNDFFKAYREVLKEGKMPIMCGGSGLYIESVLKGYKLIPVPENPDLRKKLSTKSLQELKVILAGYKTLHNTTDVDTVKRAIRAIEIEECYKRNSKTGEELIKLNNLIIGIDIDREERRQRISDRLNSRIEMGLIKEVESLIEGGVLPADLIYYGLEYKYVTMYLIGELSIKQMKKELEIAIHQFAKRQMTWFRGMERRGLEINWIPYSMPTEEKLKIILELISKNL